VTETLLHVAAAIIQRPDGRVLLAQRPAGKAYAGYWEFPGGKLEPGETPRAALDRELAEELGLAVREAAPWLVQQFRYPHAHVLLHFFRVFDWSGEPVGHDGQAFVWQTPGNFDVQPLLPANTFVLRALTLPPVYGISLAEDVGETAFLARAEAALDRGLKLVQLREKGWPEERQRALATALIALARPRGAKVLLNGDVELARAWDCDGVHLTSARLAAATSRPDLSLRASCHTRPISITRVSSDSISRCWGRCCRRLRMRGCRRSVWTGFAAIAARGALPIFALGGLAAADLPPRSQAGRMASRSAAARGPPRLPNVYPANDRRAAGSSRSPALRAVGTRYASLAQAPRSMSLHRSEQNGRQRSAAIHATRSRRNGDRRPLRGFTGCRTRARIRRRGRRRCRDPCR
jgi:8-oxo-dGTP diphosphatase